MSEIEHKLVTETYYSIVISSSNRGMPAKLNEFFSDLDIDSIGDAWYDYKTNICDFEGDFSGIEIFYCEDIHQVYQYIADKIGVDISELGETSIRITNI